MCDEASTKKASTVVPYAIVARSRSWRESLVPRRSALWGDQRRNVSWSEYREMSKYRLIHPNTNSELNAARHRTRNSSKQS